MSRLIAALFLLALAHPDTLAGQGARTAGSLAPGARVRITSAGAEPRIATVVSHAGDTLLVRWPEFANAVAVPLAGVSRLEVSTGRHRRVLKGLMWGSVAGGATGALVGAATYEPCEATEFLGCFLEPENRMQSAAWGSLVGVTLGLVVGGFAGLAPRERWQSVPLDARRVSLAVTPRAYATRVGVSVRF